MTKIEKIADLQRAGAVRHGETWYLNDAALGNNAHSAWDMLHSLDAAADDSRTPEEARRRARALFQRHADERRIFQR